jgi:hypothetical protein
MRPFALISVLAVFLTAILPLAVAQRSASGGHTAAGRTATSRNSRAGNSALGRNGHSSASRRASSLVSALSSLPFPFFGDSFNPDDIYSSGYPVAAQPPAFLMQAMQQLAGSAAGSMGQAMSPPASHPHSSSDPLMIELQNGQYVRVDSPPIDGQALPLKFAPEHSRPNSTRPAMITAAAPSQTLPSAVLIFRDGHSEEVRDYTIADGMLYARGDYYTDGYWNKKIDLTGLNVAETLQANASRSVKFVLPASPNEVITRP